MSYTMDLNKMSPTKIIQMYLQGRLEMTEEIESKIHFIPANYIMKMCMGFDALTKHLNEYYNTFHIYKIDTISFLKELKFLFNQFPSHNKKFIYMEKEQELEELVKEVWRIYPQYKKYELTYMLDQFTKDQLKDLTEKLLPKKKKARKKITKM